MADLHQCATCGAALPVGRTQCPECLLCLGLRDAPPGESAPADFPLHPALRPFGDYELLEEIARGGMGVVYRARQKSLDRIVAVKFILAGHFAAKDSVQRFRTEASAAAALRHPNIVAIHEVGVHQGEHYLAMDWVDGPNLAQFVKSTPLPAQLAARYLKIIAEAIHYAHERGILHRDLKPSNILIDANDQPHVTDFGLAKRIVAADVRRLTSSDDSAKGGKGEREKGGVDGTSPSPGGLERVGKQRKEFAGGKGSARAEGAGATESLGRGEGERFSEVKPSDDQSLLTSAATEITLSGQVLGSPNYIPPEQASGKRGAVSARSDIYSLGAILYHLLTGRGPFVSDTVADTLHQVLNDEPVAPRLLNPGVPRDLETICLKCLEKEPARRYATAQELVEELDHFLLNEPIGARPIGPAGRLWRWCRRKPVVAVLSAGFALAVMLGFAGVLSQKERAEEQTKVARRESYANMMLLAHESLELNDMGGVQELLEKSLGAFPDSPAGHLSASNPPWEWRHLQYEIRDEASVVLEGCTNSIYGMAVSQDDQWLAAGTTGGQVLLWHLPTRSLRAEWFTGNTVEHLCFSPDGQRLAIGSREATVEVLAVPSGKSLARFRERDRILGLRFLADSRRLAFISSSGWSMANLAESSNTVQSFLLLTSWRAVISHDFQMLVAAKVPQGLIFYRSNTNTVFEDVVTPQYHGAGAAISPDGLWFALALADRSIEIWSLKEPRRVRRLAGHSADVVALAWSADSRHLASGGNDQVVAVWNVSDGALLRRLQGHRAGIRVIAFSQDGSTIYSSSSDRTVRIFNSWNTKPPVGSLDFPNVTYRSQLAAGARFGCAKHNEGAVFFQTSPVLRFLDSPPVMEIRGRCGIAPDGASVIASSWEHNHCTIWRQTQSGFVKQATVEMARTIHGHPRFSADGRRVALLGTDGSLAVWQVEPWRELRRWEDVGNREDEIVFDPMGNRVFALVNPEGLFVGEIDTGRFFRMPLRKSAYSGVAVSANNRFVAISGDPTTILAMAPGEEPRRASIFPRLRVGTASVAFSRDGRRLALGCADGQIQIWSFPDLMKVGVLKGHQQGVWSLAFSEDDTLVSASPDQVRVWRAVK